MQRRSREMLEEEYEMRWQLDSEDYCEEQRDDNGDKENEPESPSVIQPPKKRGKEAKKKSWVWCHDHVTTLIPLWEAEPCLYKTTSADYKIKDKRQNALTRIRERMEENGISGLTVEDIANKPHGLKVYFAATKGA